MMVLRAPAKEVVTQHASGEQKNRDRQQDNEEELCESKPGWILFSRIDLIPIRRHALLSRKDNRLAQACGLYHQTSGRCRQSSR